jgi:hypothetical protein
MRAPPVRRGRRFAVSTRSHTGWMAVLAMCLCAAAAAQAQTNELSQAILSLPSRPIASGRLFDDARLFGGLVDALITNVTGAPDDFGDADVISFRVVPRNGSAPPAGLGFTTPFVGTRAEFEQWARDNAASLLAVLFPGGLSAAAAGRDVAALYSQQLMLTTVLDANEMQTRGRLGAGGLVESEWLRHDVREAGDSAWGIQGLYGFNSYLSLQARFGQQRETLRTSATSLAVDYHPYIERGTTTRIRVGGSARSGFLYSSSQSASAFQPDALRFGSIDVAGGGWASVRRRFANVMVGGGAMLLGTKNYVPPGDEGTFRSAFAHALNDRGIAYDLTLGGTARYDATNRVSLIGRVAETYGLDSSTDRPATHLVLGGVMFALAPGASLDAGYKVTSFGDTLAQSLFFQGNFGW